MSLTIKNLRASSAALQAEVVIGQRDNGGVVTTTVRLNRNNEDIQAAFAMLDNVLLREAQAAVDQAATNERRRRAEFRERTGREVTV